MNSSGGNYISTRFIKLDYISRAGDVLEATLSVLTHITLQMIILREYIIKQSSWKVGHAWDNVIGSYRESVKFAISSSINFRDQVAGWLRFNLPRCVTHEMFLFVRPDDNQARELIHISQLKKVHILAAGEKLIHMYVWQDYAPLCGFIFLLSAGERTYLHTFSTEIEFCCRTHFRGSPYGIARYLVTKAWLWTTIKSVNTVSITF